MEAAAPGKHSAKRTWTHYHNSLTQDEKSEVLLHVKREQSRKKYLETKLQNLQGAAATVRQVEVQRIESGLSEVCCTGGLCLVPNKVRGMSQVPPQVAVPWSSVVMPLLIGPLIGFSGTPATAPTCLLYTSDAADE